MNLPNYETMLKSTDQEIKENLVPIRALQAKQQGMMELSKLDEQIVNLELKVQSLCVVNPLNWIELTDAQEQVLIVKKRKEIMTKALNDLFGENNELQS